MQNELAEKISDAELEVMKLLWQAGEALPVTEIRGRLQRAKGWEATTVKTLVSRLVSKGAVLQEKRNVYYYSPLITEREYNAWATDSLIRRLYNGSARELVAALVRAEGLTQSDVEELRQMFRVED
ncbi:MAG: BlaI/MecI/CopY family transcriptional regulator [Oscillospiraceae bacterium]|nr:BlaI/MecI/CopY family transcriptional regulator [Oscillospiraceae bacterium]